MVFSCFSRLENISSNVVRQLFINIRLPIKLYRPCRKHKKHGRVIIAVSLRSENRLDGYRCFSESSIRRCLSTNGIGCRGKLWSMIKKKPTVVLQCVQYVCTDNDTIF